MFRAVFKMSRAVFVKKIYIYQALFKGAFSVTHKHARGRKYLGLFSRAPFL